MPIQDLQISRFDGMVGVAEERDLPPGVAIYAKNLNMITEDGLFVPMPLDSNTGASTSGATWFVPMEDGETVIFNSAGSIYKITSLSGTPSVSLVGTVSGYTSASNSSGVSDGEAVHVGLGRNANNPPQWVGRIYHDQFENDDTRAAPASVINENAELVTSSVYFVQRTWGTKVTEEGAAIFVEGRTYFWYATLVYDATQESLPLLLMSSSLPESTFADNEFGYDQITIRFKAIVDLPSPNPNNYTSLSQRVTRVNLYRAESLGLNATSAQSGLTLVKSVDINSSEWTSYVDGAESGHYIDIIDAGEALGDYETRTGVSPTLDHMTIHYGLSCQAESYHIVADCWHPELKDIPNYMFRSKSYRYDTWDWANDYLVLPQRPVALVSYLGRVYAFAEGRTFVIDPNSFTVIDTWEGIGSYASKSVVVTDRGMFWVSSKNIYYHDGNQVNVIGNPVLSNRFNSAYGYSSHATTDPPLVMYDPEYDALVILYAVSTGPYQLEGLIYHVATRRWCAIDAAADNTIGAAVHATNGSVYYHIGGTLYKLFGSATLRTWDFVSRNLVDSLGTKEIFHYAYVHHNGTSPTLTFYEDDPDYTSADTWSGTASAGDNVTKGKINTGTWNYVRNFQLAMTSVPNTREVSHITITKRTVTPR